MAEKQENIDTSIEISDQSGELFTAVWNWFLDREDISDKEKMVWIALKSYAGYQEIRPSIKSISRRASVSVRTTQRTLNSLADKQMIRIDRRWDTKGSPLPNQYILLPVKAIRKTDKDGEGGCQGDTPPGVTVSPPPRQAVTTPGVRVTPEVDKYNKNKLKTTTPLTPPEPAQASGAGPGASGGREFIEQVLVGTLLATADPGRISRAAGKYNRTSNDVAVIVDVLDLQYRRSQRAIEDPTALFITALRDGVTPPEDYVPRAQRKAEIEAKREEARKKGAVKEELEQCEKIAYTRAETVLLSLEESKRAELFKQAEEKLSPNLRIFSKAIRSMALQILIEKTRARDGP